MQRRWECRKVLVRSDLRYVQRVVANDMRAHTSGVDRKLATNVHTLTSPMKTPLALLRQTEDFSLNVSMLNTNLLSYVLPMGGCLADLDVAVMIIIYMLGCLYVHIWLPCLRRVFQ